MKNEIFKLITFPGRTVFMVGLLISFHCVIIAQNDGNNSDKKEKARISIDYTNYNNTAPRLTATVKTKVDNSYENVEGVNVIFFTEAIDEANKIGQAVTNAKGKAILIFPESLTQQMSDQNNFLFIASIENDQRFNDSNTEIEIKKSFTEMTLTIEDSIKQVRFFVATPDSLGTNTPVEGVEAKIYVKRLFGLLPLSAEFEPTDEEGFTTVEFPDNIPGDADGNVIIVAQIEDHEEFGNNVTAKKIAWGIPLKADDSTVSRELWSARANAPISLIILVNSMIVGIWGVIGYIIFLLFKIRKFGKTQLDTQ